LAGKCLVTSEIVDQGPGIPQQGDVGQPQTWRPDSDAKRRLQEAWARSQELMDQIEKGRSQRERLYDSASARLHARLASMPVIEQAKGVLMAQQRCGPDEAFELLRRASQRANIKVSVLAAQIVEQVSGPTPDGSAEHPRAVARGKA